MTSFAAAPGLEGALLASAGVKVVLKHTAAEVEARAKAIAPVVTGEYRASIHIDDSEGEERVVADPTNASGEGYGAYEEFGTSDTPAHHTLLNALGVA